MAKRDALKNQSVAVIGAGWAGCAAACELVQQGALVTLLESSRNLGGRARGVTVHGHELDNGQHILLGAYTESLRLMRLVGVDTQTALLNLPLQMVYPALEDGMSFITPRLPAPLHLLLALISSAGLSFADKMALARFSSTARWMGWRLNEDCSVIELLERFDQTPRLCRLMWIPLCIAALNTPPERASAQVFLNVLRDSLGARRAASDMLIPRLDLSSILPEKAAEFVRVHGGQVSTAHTVTGLQQSEHGKWQLELKQAEASNVANYDAVILACDFANADRLLSTLPATDQAVPLPAMSYEPITTCYLQYAQNVRLPRPMLALLDDAGQKKWGQYVFDRGQLHTDQAGLLAVVVSVSQAATEIDKHELAMDIAAQLAQSLGMPELAQPIWHQCISEKRATFSCAPGLHRPDNLTAYPGLYLAGDYTKGDYPATLEGAVRSGIAASQAIIKDLKAAKN
ncbi:hydroxysqualene dehydroxylase HpnE [Undibacterium sp.]|uniref:hydroxysqualene dehydroxylase HpnE n=1 Tax=Undibacterium sp. TaxID=1914977 RepID=UPI00272FB68F|nr:hydroxysqualene dehydroxylase HpnE [Undibacterium sp.]MDP1976966.1 hydroxysqualene dehydroxylase HpnE [Undibacterium sp.]